MSLEKITKLASVEIIFPDRAVNVAWHTYITENGDVISGPSIHRKAFPNEDISEVLPEITEFVSADYLQVVAQNAKLAQQAVELEASNAEHVRAIADLQSMLAQRDARIADLEALHQSQPTGAT